MSASWGRSVLYSWRQRSKQRCCEWLPVPDRLQGTSALPLLERPERPWKRAVFNQFLRRGRWLGADGIETMGYSVRTERYHYVAWMNWATRRITARELYDLEGDPAETVNLAPRPESRSVLRELERQRRDRWRAVVPSPGGAVGPDPPAPTPPGTSTGW